MYLVQNYDLLNLAKTLEEIKKDLEVKRNPLFLMPKPAPISDPLTPSRRHTPKPHPLQPHPKALSPFSLRHFELPQKVWARRLTVHISLLPALFLHLRPAIWEVLRPEPWGWTSKHNLSSVPSTTCCQKKNEWVLDSWSDTSNGDFTDKLL